MAIKDRERETQKKRVASARKLADASSGQASKAFRKPEAAQMWQPEEGEYTIDIVGYPAGKGNPAGDPGYLVPARLYKIHRIGPNSDSYLCPSADPLNKPCPVCEYRADVIKREGFKSDLAKALRAKDRELWNVVVRSKEKEEKKGVQLWDMANFCFGRAVTAALDRKPECDTYHDPDEGYSLEITLEEEKLGQFAFLKCNHVRFVKRDDKLDAKLKPYALDDLIIETDYDKLKSVFELGIGGADDDESAKGKVINDDETANGEARHRPARDEDDDEDDEPKARKRSTLAISSGTSRPSRDEEEDEDEEEPPLPKKHPVKAKDEDEDEEKPAKKGGLQVGDLVTWKKQECEVMKIKNGYLELEDEDGNPHSKVDPATVKKITAGGGDNEEEEKEDEDE